MKELSGYKALAIQMLIMYTVLVLCTVSIGEEIAMSKSTRNSGKSWSKDDVKQLKELAKDNTPTRVIGLKLGRTESAIQSKASSEGVSLKPTNQSPYNRKKG